ncbi:LysM peptidoglycan-binding domain-containing protein [Paramicrobacterium chengjingii]|uniref:LysM peptidoglycan-binding domain-containing protein n=1 Tax=Paramicrobacterium chengjingii TaxID=2769067 RepID=A0ABX6YEB0_9MICO|nr:LysM peptidoglycan-binding domain-containing protein [Microbacterium chengjingii]QPZ37132.1 LysM peptidoglycan-binding domain-containing protein [Microbacterium chengjingii]
MTTQQTNAAPRLRLTARGRAVLTGIASIPLVFGIAFGAVHASSAVAADTSSTETFEYVTVSTGESLWMLAERIAPDHDPREVVAEIVDLNQLDTSSVAAGERIAIPSQYEEAVR